MKKLNRILIVFLALIVLFVTCFLAQGMQAPSPKLPPGIQALVPQGHELKSPQTFVSGTMGNVNFFASKQIGGRRDVYTSEYHFDLTIMEKPQVLVKSQGPIYQKQLEQNSQNHFNDCIQKVEVVDPSIGYDKPQLTKYPWGNGITQRVIHKYMGGGKGPDEIEYQCEYFGLITTTGAIKKYKLSVYGVENREVADKWATKIAEQVEKTSISNLAVK
jgi:hypothetical protein